MSLLSDLMGGLLVSLCFCVMALFCFHSVHSLAKAYQDCQSLRKRHVAGMVAMGYVVLGSVFGVLSFVVLIIIVCAILRLFSIL